MSRFQLLQWIMSVPEDEPIFCMRAKDNAVPSTMTHYRDECRKMGSPPGHLNTAEIYALEIENWRDDNKDKCKTPD